MDTTTNDVIFYINFPKKQNIVLGEITKQKHYIEQFIFYNKFTFKKGEGFDLLLKVVNQAPTKLSQISIQTNKGKEYTIERFLGVLENCNVR